MNLIYHEIKRLIVDYYKCDSPATKELILSDIKLLNEALLLSKLTPYCFNDLSLQRIEKLNPICPNLSTDQT